MNETNPNLPENSAQENSNIFTTTVNAGRSRRSFLKLAGKTALVGAAATALWVKTHPSDPAEASVVSDGNGSNQILDKRAFPANSDYTSQVFTVSSGFSALGVFWEVSSGKGETVNIQIRVSSDGTTFSNWEQAEQDETQESRWTSSQITRFFARLMLVTGKYIQFKVNGNGANVTLVGLSPIKDSGGPRIATPAQPDVPRSATSAPTIITRAGWGANESYRYDSHGNLLWPAEYRTVKTIIVHHSDTQNLYNADPSADVRSIYYYHAITKGWGDIGYNYLIDWKGNIYEGRYGGEGVVGGHAYQYNYGSIGICLIGNFFSVKPTTAQLNALQNLMSNKSKLHNIDPTAKIFFVDRNNVATISGHRDVIDTTCPGDAAYGLLPGWRTYVKQALGGGTTTASTGPNLQVISSVITPTTLPSGTLLRVDATIKNTGNATAQTQNPAPGFVYNEGDNYVTRGFDKQSGKVRFCLDFGGNTSGTSHPYRWGLGNPLAPGATTTVTGYIKLNSNKVTNYYGAAIQEYVQYFDDNVGNQLVSVINSNPAATAASRASDPNIWYFSQTGHNLGYTFRDYWLKHGGLAMFGYPITEEFTEISATDGKAYTVQYFERNRFEYHPEFVKSGNPVLLGLLGTQIASGRNFPKVAAFTSTSGNVYFSATGHSLSGVFLNYWNTHGGLAIFGYPISEPLQETNPDDGKTYTVQYFERNRFEHHPELAGTQFEVELGLLGKQTLRARGWLS